MKQSKKTGNHVSKLNHVIITEGQLIRCYVMSNFRAGRFRFSIFRGKVNTC